MDAAIYCRISIDDEGRGLGVGRQRDDCRRDAERRGWTVVAEFVENNVSADDENRSRKEFDRMLRGLVAGEYGAIIAYDLDRLQRTMRSFAKLYDAAASSKAIIAWVGGQANFETGEGIFELELRSTFGREELRKIKARTRRKMAEIAKDGGAHGGRRPYGFEKDDREKLDEREAAIIREAAQAIIDGASIRSVCQRLNSRGDFTTGGKRWSNTTLVRMLRRPRLIGVREHNGTLTKAKWRAILTAEDQRRLRVTFDGNLAPRRREVTALLSGLIFCGVCGARLSYKLPSGRRGSVYVCPEKSCVAIAAKGTETAVITNVRRISSQLRNFYPVAPVVAQVDTEPLRERMDAARAAYKDGRISLEDWIDVRDDAAARIAKIDTENLERTEAAMLAARGQKVREWDELSDDERRAALSGYVYKVIVRRAHTRRPGRVFDAGRVFTVWRADLIDDTGEPSEWRERVARDGRPLKALSAPELLAEWDV